MKWLNRWFFVELAASVLTLAGIWIGSTSLLGASMYLASMVFWFALTINKRIWGLMPLNVASTVVTCINLWRSVA